MNIYLYYFKYNTNNKKYNFKKVNYFFTLVFYF